jgi:hypothetical protein
MASYLVMEPAFDRRGDGAVFIRDAFAPLAIIIPVVWLLWHRLWFEAAMAFCASVILVGASAWLEAPKIAGIGSVLIGIYVALEGSALKIAAARRNGYADERVVDAGSVTGAEERYYLSRLPEMAAPVSRVSEPLSRQQASPRDAGLFALPGSH